jgi:hypothetical protein
MTSPLRRAICFVVYMAMCIGGGAAVAFQIFVSPVVVRPVFGTGVALLGIGGYLLWEDFLRSKPHR